jgi:hypothetical protein
MSRPPPAFRRAQAVGPEAEAALDSASAQLGRSPARARLSLDRATALLRHSSDARLTISRDILKGRLQIAEGRRTEGTALLESAREHARRLGFLLLVRKAQE